MTNNRIPKGTSFFAGIGIALALFVCALFVFPLFGNSLAWTAPAAVELVSTTPFAAEPPPAPRVTHLATPVPVRAIYMTTCVAGRPDLRNKLLGIATSTEVNSIVIDIKDASGTVSFDRESTTFDIVIPTKGCPAVPDMREFINTLHDNGVYVIGRISVFQDPNFAVSHPKVAVQKTDGTVWKDKKGLAFVDVNTPSYWDEIISLAKDSYAIGFDEINFDYIRYPSDGDMQNITFALVGSTTKAQSLENFFSYLHNGLLGTGIVMSADLFGMTTSNTDDLGIGQVLENALPYFDYIAPMVYPSHYPPGFNGHKNPAAVPYEIISYAMGKGIERTKAASSTPTKLRAWLQDFNHGAVYTADMVRAQKKALYDLGLDSWMMWSPSNRYTTDALDSSI